MGNNEQSKMEAIDIIAFFTTCPPSDKSVKISNLVIKDSYGKYTLNTPDIELYCNGERCEGLRFFQSDRKYPILSKDEINFEYLTYTCKNCGEGIKLFSILISIDEAHGAAFGIKLGELPAFCRQIPTKLFKLLGPDKELFLAGKRCENQGLGIGAFAYYRRVIENQKNRLIDEFIKVAEKYHSSREIVEALNRAKIETQFTKSIETIKDLIPQELKIDNHNPLTLLHSALSDGLHEQSDDECLKRATSIRMVLTELSERLSNLLKEKIEFEKAITDLLKFLKK